MSGFLQNFFSDWPLGFAEEVRDFTGGEAAREAAEAIIEGSRNARELIRGQSDVIREDAAPLRDMRNQSLQEMLNLYSGQGAFRDSSDYNVLRDAARSAVGSSPARNALLERADQIGNAQFDAYRNRTATQAGISSGGLNTTNRLLQAGADAQARLLNEAATQAGNVIQGQSQQRANTATGIFGAFI